MAYIDVIGQDKAAGRLKEIYEDLVKKRGKLAGVHTIQSLNPESIVNHMDLYMTLMYGESPLKRYQREMMAVIVSVDNECDYCIRHHSEALQHFWKDDKKVKALILDFHSIDLNKIDIQLCEYAHRLTLYPGKASEKSVTDLKDTGLDDRAILDATMIIAYFNFVNRIVMGLGVKIESDHGEGYNYD